MFNVCSHQGSASSRYIEIHPNLTQHQANKQGFDMVTHICHPSPLGGADPPRSGAH